MNHQGSKKILFNKSTLLSLKAELLKKQEEVKEKKYLPQNRLENFKPPVTLKSEKEVKRKSFKDALNTELDTDELEAQRKSKLALEKKAELYEHLTDSTGTSQLAGKFLVDFHTKKQQEPVRAPTPEPEPPEEPLPDDDDEWMEYTDCLGRTRKCLKTDLELYKKRDRELMRSMTGRDIEEPEQVEEPKVEVPKPLLVQTTVDYLASLRDKWEHKEQELLKKDDDIHYQDLLFDEARQHGVSYYNFSTTETERRAQQAELARLRAETERAQLEAEERRAHRDALIAARVAAARARQRARAGLPPEDPEEKKNDLASSLLDWITEQKKEAAEKAKAEERKDREEKDKERQKLRDAYIREWDLGKEGLTQKKEGFREMSQEEYVEQQREKRIDEFAPVNKDFNNRKSLNVFDERGNVIGSNMHEKKTWAEVRQNTEIITNLDEIPATSSGLFFSSKTEKMYSNFVRPSESINDNKSSNNKDETVNKLSNPFARNSELSPIDNVFNEDNANNRVGIDNRKSKSFEPTAIVNELSDDEDNCDNSRNTKGSKSNKPSLGAEVPPPPTFEYYGPTTTKHARLDKPFRQDVREAYEQGQKVLHAKEEKRKMAKEYEFLF